MPSQKPGMTDSISAVTVRALSSTEYCFTAEMMPRTTPTMDAMPIETVASKSV